MLINGGGGKRGGEGMGEWDKVKIYCLNPGLERFFSTISRFKCGLCGKTLIAWNS